MITPIPLIAVSDVQDSSRFYEQVLGAIGSHGGGDAEHAAEYQQLRTDEGPVLQLHSLTVDHHHGEIGDPSVALGNGLLLWFTTERFDEAVARALATGAEVVAAVHVNPNSGCRELWIRDPDGYVVVLAEPFAADGGRRVASRA